MKKKISKKIIIISLFAIGILALFSLFIFRKKDQGVILAEASRGTVLQTVSETGQVQKEERINLAFENSGRIERIYVKEGEEVNSGDLLAKLETSELNIRIEEARSVMAVAEAELTRILDGATKEKIKIAQTLVSNAQISLSNEEQSLKDIEIDAKNDLDAANEDLKNYLEEAYLKAYNSDITVESLIRSYFSSNDQEGLRVRENEKVIEGAILTIKIAVEDLKKNPAQEKIDSSALLVKAEIGKVFDSLKIIRETCETQDYFYQVTSADKTAQDTHISNISMILTGISNLQQTVASTKTTNDYNINSAKARVELAKGSLEKSKNDLEDLISPPQKTEVDLYQARLNQVKSQVQLLELQKEKSYLRSPVSGRIAEIRKKEGEYVSMASEIALSLFPQIPYEIKVDIYEEDIVKVQAGNPVEIELTAFPERIFFGKVISINPAEKLIDGVVYYEVKVELEGAPEEIKPGMTADITIKTAEKSDVLVIPGSAIETKDKKQFIRVLENGTTTEREVQVGLKGNSNMIEILAGLKEGEKFEVSN